MRGCFGKPGENYGSLSISLKLVFLSGMALVTITAMAQQPSADSTKNKKIPSQVAQKKPNFEIYGFILTDVIYDFKQMDPQMV